MAETVGGERPDRFAFYGSPPFLYRILTLLCALAISVPVFYISRPDRINSAPAAFSVASTSRTYVRISGAVRHPGLYALSVNTMTMTAIKMADPISPATHGISGIAAADLVANGMALHLAIQPDGAFLVTKSLMSASERLVMGIPLDINTINETDLDRVPGIGPMMAKRIVMYRQNNGGVMVVSDLLLIEGIGEKKYKQLLKYF